MGYVCTEDGCDRSFLTEGQLHDHSEAVHTFDDIRKQVRAALREKYVGTSVLPPVPSVYVYVRDLAADWVVFELDNGPMETGPWKMPYSIDATGKVTLGPGDPVRVVETTIYVPVSQPGASTSSLVDAFMEAAAAAAKSAAKKKPYGNVTYADPKNGKYPIDTEEHVRAALSYINQAKNAAKYPMNGVSLASVKSRIKAAAKRFGIQVS